MLKTLIEQFIQKGVDDNLLEYLTSNSNLPGPRGNLELAGRFANYLTEFNSAEIDKLWLLCGRMVSISAEDAPVNTSREFIPFCGTVGIGSIGTTHSGYFQKALSRLKELANDSRWRMREAVAMGLQRLMVSNADAVLSEFERWIADDHLLELRAVAAAVAEPALLKVKEVAKTALRLNQQIIEKLTEVEDRKTEDFRVLRKALGYTFSVVIVPLPNEGFEYLRQLTKINDSDLNWIIKENLKKNRLTKNFPNDVNSLKKLLN